MDHLLATFQSQDEALTKMLADASAATTTSVLTKPFDAPSTWRELLEGLRELLRTKNLKDSAESEASIYVGLPLISFVEKVVASCVSTLEARANGDAERSKFGK